MAAGTLKTLHDFVFGGEPYTKAAIVPYISQLPEDRGVVYADLDEPLVRGYVRHEAATLRELFPDPIGDYDFTVRMVSVPLEYRNDSGGDVLIRGIALVVYLDPTTPVVLCAPPDSVIWRAGSHIVGRFTVASNVLGGI